ncbi:MAG: PAS domain-containing sensor histidine kinase [Thermonemataceae bacterium]|nr:PAS domain-containing sensor histidine kinase [Thermonemataceae bacterium]
MPLTQKITQLFDENCAWLVIDGKGTIREHNQWAKRLLEPIKKVTKRSNFFKYLESSAPKPEHFVQNKSWMGDIRLKGFGQDFYTLALPFNDTQEKQTILAIYPFISARCTQRSPRLFKILQNIADGVLVLDIETGKITEANETALKYLQYTNEEILSINYLQIDSELQENKNSWTKFLIELKLKTPEALQMLSQYRKKNGTSIPVESSIKYEETENEDYITVIFRDISNNDRLDEILDTQQKKFQLLIENLEDSILLLDEAANIIYASPAAHKNWGYKDNELQQQDLFDLAHPYDSSLVQKIFFEIINTRRKLFKTTFRILYKDGSSHWVEVKAKNLLREPSINAVLLIVQNVTQQTLAEEKLIQALENEKKLNEELAKREEKLKQTLEILREKELEQKKTNQMLEYAQSFANMGSWYIDIPEENIIWSRQTFLAFGMNPDTDAAPKNRQELRQYIHPEDGGRLREMFAKILSGESNEYEVEVRQYQKNTDEYRWFMTKAQVVKEQDKIIGVSGITLDIHKNKLAEEKLKETNEELSKANAELDRFVYSVSHDLRAPISSLLGLIGLSRMTEDLSEIKQYMDLQEKSIHKLDNFIKDILDYSRNARLEITSQEIFIEEIINNCLEQHNHMENAKRINKSIEINQNVPLYSDKNRLSIILNNLLSNAIKYANLRQEESFIKISVNISEKKAEIIIIDNGIGIAKEHISKVFNMFYRATDSLAGSGLGLYIVKEAVKKLEGEIFLDSEIGIGTKIYLLLPNLLDYQHHIPLEE